MEGDSSTRGRNMVGLLFWKNKHFGAGFEGVWEWIVFNLFLHRCSGFSLHYFSFVSCFPHRAAYKQNFSEIRIYSKHVIWAQAHCRLPMPELLTRASCRKDWMRSLLRLPSCPPDDPIGHGTEGNWNRCTNCRDKPFQPPGLKLLVSRDSSERFSRHDAAVNALVCAHIRVGERSCSCRCCFKFSSSSGRSTGKKLIVRLAFWSVRTPRHLSVH